MIYQILFKISNIFINSDDLHIPKNTPDNSLALALKIVFAIAGVISIIIITVAGLQMALSGGTPETINKSRNAVIYAVVGLVICITGYTIVTFVVNKL